MAKTDSVVKCLKCECVLNEPGDLDVAKRKPCPACGSLDRLFDVRLHDSIDIHDHTDAKARHSGKTKPYRETRTGDSFSMGAKKWMIHTRIIDRENDWYEETVIDPITGQVVHRCSEPLSKHRGHGSAKQSKPKNP